MIMKIRKFALLIILSICVAGFARAGSYVIEDDIYYNPNDKNPVVEQKEKEAAQAAAQAAAVSDNAAVQKTLVMTADKQFFDVDEYNRRGESATEMSLNDLVDNQTEEYVEYNIVDENGDDGYYLNGFTGSASDYEYSLRIRRFHNPKFVVSVSDPFYSDIYFLDNNDWNVYITDNFAWVTPTWTNPWYWNYMWAPYSYTSWSWRWSLGPWSLSYGYDPLYRWGGYWGGYWGWNSWYCSPFYHHHHYYSPYYYNRPHYGWHNRPGRPHYTPNGRQPNRYGGRVVSSGSGSTNSRRATVGTASSSTGRRTVSSVTSTSRGSSVSGVRTNRGTVISNSSSSSGNNSYRFESVNSSRRPSSSSSSVSRPSTTQSRRQTSINSNSTNSSRNSYNSVGRTNRRSSSSFGSRSSSSSRTPSYSAPSSSRRSSGSYSAPSSSSRRSSGTSSRGSGGGGRGGRR